VLKEFKGCKSLRVGLDKGTPRGGIFVHSFVFSPGAIPACVAAIFKRADLRIDRGYISEREVLGNGTSNQGCWLSGTVRVLLREWTTC